MLTRLTAISLIFLFSACDTGLIGDRQALGPKKEQKSSNTLKIIPRTLTLQTGGQFKFIVLSAFPVSFSIQQPSTSTITPKGVFTAGISSGKDEIVIIEDKFGNKDKATVTIENKFGNKDKAIVRTIIGTYRPMISPAKGYIETSKSLQLSVSSGSPPYSKWSVISGDATISANGKLTVGSRPGPIIVSISDATLKKAQANFTSYLPLQISPKTISLNLSDKYQFTASNGIPGIKGYVFSIPKNATGFVTPQGLFSAPNQTGSTRVKVTDSIGNQKTATIAILGAIKSGEQTIFGKNGITKLNITSQSWSSIKENIRDFSFSTGGKIIVAGDVAFYGSSQLNKQKMFIAKFNSNGSIDSTFGNNGVTVLDFNKGFELGKKILIQPDGEIVVAGQVQVYLSNGNSSWDMAVARVHANGKIDTTFGTKGYALFNIGRPRSYYSPGKEQNSDEKIVGLHWSLGKIVVTGSTNAYNSRDSRIKSTLIAARFLSKNSALGNAGSGDSTFICDYQAQVGICRDYNYFGYRYDHGSEAGTSFVDSLGNVYIGGVFWEIGTGFPFTGRKTKNLFYKFKSNGQHDSKWGENFGKTFGITKATATTGASNETFGFSASGVKGDYAYFAYSVRTDLNNSSQDKRELAVASYQISTGRINSSFGPPRKYRNWTTEIPIPAGISYTPNSIELQSDGKIIVASQRCINLNCTGNISNHRTSVLRILANGSALDASFGNPTLRFRPGEILYQPVGVEKSDQMGLKILSRGINLLLSGQAHFYQPTNNPSKQIAGTLLEIRK